MWSKSQLIEIFKDRYDQDRKQVLRSGFMKYEPTIPVVGKGYRPGEGLLVYGSAENLTHHRDCTSVVPEWFGDDRVWNRHRAALESGPMNRKPRFFPFIGIAPIEGGELLTASRWVAESFRLSMAEEPREFLDTIAVSNWCKFVLKPVRGRNRDYAGTLRLLRHSLPFVAAELAALRPKVALLPHRILTFRRLRKAMLDASPGTTFIGAPQCNSRVINCHLSRFASCGVKLSESSQRTTLARWVDESSVSSSLWTYLAMLERLFRGRPKDGCIIYKASLV